MTYPTFRKHGLAMYKILCAEDFVSAYPPGQFNRGEVTIETSPRLIAKILREGAHITENQFIDAYVRAIHDIQMEVYPQGMQVINEPAY